MYQRIGKRCLDVAVSATAIIALAPVLAVVALLVRRRLGSPVLFTQERPGRNGQTFRMVKFRSMTDQRDSSGQLLSDEHRLPPFGKWLRSTSLDELPELWNVLRGDMSLVGPRPLLKKYLPLYTERQARRHEVRPGITGLAQVNGRNQCDWEQRFELDVQYVESISLRGDLSILLKTLAPVLLRRGVSQDNHCTMPNFQGTPSPQPKRAA